jgi:hypothetical protein
MLATSEMWLWQLTERNGGLSLYRPRIAAANSWVPAPICGGPDSAVAIGTGSTLPRRFSDGLLAVAWFRRPIRDMMCLQTTMPPQAREEQTNPYRGVEQARIQCPRRRWYRQSY